VIDCLVAGVLGGLVVAIILFFESVLRAWPSRPKGLSPVRRDELRDAIRAAVKDGVQNMDGIAWQSDITRRRNGEIRQKWLAGKEYRPPVHPGVLIQKELDRRGWKLQDLYEATGWKDDLLARVVAETADMSGPLAVALAAAVGGSAGDWLYTQARHEEGRAAMAEDLALAKEPHQEEPDSDPPR